MKSTTPSSTRRQAPLSGCRRRNGSVARLPDCQRNLVNTMMRDGVPYAAIIQKLAESGFKLGKSNLSRWYQGGHQDWLKEQLWLEEMKGRLEFVTSLLDRKDAPSLTRAGLHLASSHFLGVLMRLDPTPPKTGHPDDAVNLIRITNSLCRLSEGGH